ncbi:MAG: HDIG domain-containing protein [Candidatus Omnitrophica bacterium]|nr:HDIG domain-containing protein [Candidatus Omnitrophota bacterium]
MQREEALDLVRKKLKNKNLVKHCLAVEACMRKLAQEFGENQDLWGLAGLLHDLDYEDTKDDFSQHGFITAEILKEQGINEEVIEAIKSHPGHIERKTKMAKALYAVDPLTGLIVASALMHPEKSLRALDVKFVLNRFKEKSFARGANREQIRSSQELGITLSEFISICLEAMKGISEELGL